MDETIVILGGSDLTSNNTSLQMLNEVPLYVVIILSLFYSIVPILAVGGNLCVLCIVATSMRMITATNFFIANLACADIIIGLFPIPFHFPGSPLQRWMLPSFLCPFCPFIEVLSVNVSTLTLTAIALDKYRAIMKPLGAQITKLAAKLIILGIWAIAFSASVPYAVVFRVVLNEENGKPLCTYTGTSPSKWKFYNRLLLSLQYFIPVCFISYAYCRMYIRLKNGQSNRVSRLIKSKRKMINMLFLIVAVFGLCWLPLEVYNIVQELIPSVKSFPYISVMWYCCHWLSVSHSWYKPFIYALCNECFNREFKRKLRQFFSIPQTREEDRSLHSHHG